MQGVARHQQGAHLAAAIAADPGASVGVDRPALRTHGGDFGGEGPFGLIGRDVGHGVLFGYLAARPDGLMGRPPGARGHAANALTRCWKCWNLFKSSTADR